MRVEPVPLAINLIPSGVSTLTLENSLTALSERASTLVDQIQTEEAAKHALVMPFVQALGYDPFNPMEVVPEFTADIGTRKGEKVDYAIMHDGQPSILIECKQVSDPLDETTVSQLYRYFTVTHARIGVLTNGTHYKFFSDLDESNKMDVRPFFEFDLLSLDERTIEELRRFEKQSFDIEKTLEAAAVLKYVRGMKRALQEQLTEPDDAFVRWLARYVYTKSFTKSVRERFARLVVKAFREFINDRIDHTLKTAMARDSASPDDELDDAAGGEDRVKGIVTTAQELEGFMIVKAILHGSIDISRVSIRDTRSYCGVLFDDTNRQPICRLRFNNPDRLSVGIFDDQKQEVQHGIDSLDGIYDHAEAIRRRAQLYSGEPTQTA